MKSVLAIAVGLASLSMGTAAEMTVRYESKTETKCVTDANGVTRCVEVTTTVPVVYTAAPAPTFATVPPGHHAHRMVDGSVMIHSNDNLNDPAAHVGVAGEGWPKIATAGQVVQLTTPMATCPTGTCPTSVSAVATTRVRESIRETVRLRGRFLSRLFNGRLARAFSFGGC